MAQAGAALR